MRRRCLWFAFTLAAAPAAAADCSRFADPMAYNACLASQGPAARQVHVGAAPTGAARAAPARHAAASVTRHGRSELVFSPRR